MIKSQRVGKIETSSFIEFLVIDRQCLPKTAEAHEYRLLKIFRFLKKHQLQFNLNGCRKYLVHLQGEKRRNATLTAYIITIRHYCRFLKKDFGEKIPLLKVIHKIPDILSVKEIEAILKAPRKSLTAKRRRRYDLILTLLAQTGCRLGEILELKVEDLNSKDNTFIIRQTKTRKQRIIPISEKLNGELGLYLKDKSPSEYVFPSPLGGRLTNNAVWLEIRRRAKEADIKKRVSPHILRHSYITELLRHDISVLKVQRLVGHEQLSTTQAYTHLLFEDLRMAAMRHPLVAKHRNPNDIINEIQKKVEGYGLRGDPRFFYEVSRSGDGLKVSIFIR